MLFEKWCVEWAIDNMFCSSKQDIARPQATTVAVAPHAQSTSHLSLAELALIDIAACSYIFAWMKRIKQT